MSNTNKEQVVIPTKFEAKEAYKPVLLKKYRESKKIDKHLYHELYLACKANQYKSKKNLADAIEKIIYKKGLEQKTAAQKLALKEKKGKK
jgi:large subunit ribosomal protein L19e